MAHINSAISTDTASSSLQVRYKVSGTQSTDVPATYLEKMKVKKIMLDLHKCVHDGDETLIRQCLESGCDVNAKNELGETPLVCVDYNKSVDLTILLAAGADVNVTDRYGRSPLHLAVEFSCLKSVRLLGAAGANVNAVDRLRRTPLQLAVRYNNYKIMKKLITLGADRTRTLVVYKGDHEKMIEFLENVGASFIVKQERNESSLFSVELMSSRKFWHHITRPEFGVNTYDSDGFTPLHLAVFRGNLHHVQMLLDSGADLTLRTKNSYRQTPLHLAVIGSAVDNYEIIQLLIERGVDVFAEDSNGFPPVHALVSRGKAINTAQILRLLIDSGADAMTRLKDGKTLLHVAVGSNSVRNVAKVIKVLLNNGADIDAQDKFGYTPLDMALNRRDFKVIKILLDCGKDAARKKPISTDLNTFHLAAINSDVELIQFLARTGIDLNMKTTTGYTALHLVVKNKNHVMCDVLLRNGADVDCKSSNGTTPLHIAIKNGDVGCIRLLLVHGANLYEANSKGESGLKMALLHGTDEIKFVAVEYAAILTFTGKSMAKDVENIIDSNSEFSRRFNDCMIELKRLDTNKFYNDVSFLDLLIADTKMLSQYASNEKLIKSFDLSRRIGVCNHDNFPVYCSIFSDRFDAEVEYQSSL